MKAVHPQSVCPAAFFLKSPVSAANPKEVTITGQVPATNPPVIVRVQGNLTALGNPYPVDFIFTNSTLATEATPGSVAHFWDTGLQSWRSSTKSAKNSTWDGAAIGRNVAAGDGFFLKDITTAAERQWSAEKYYTWP